jgi:type VI secretion system secreted protein VgrG
VQALLKAIDAKQDGQYSGAVGGQEAKKAKAGARDLDDPVERFAKPYVVLDTPSSAAFASPAGIAAFSGQDTSITAQGDVHAAAAHTVSLVSGQTTSLYTHEGEFQAMAANGNLSLRAHTDQLEILADKDISVVSVNDEITVTAKRIEMVGGDSKIVLDGANIDYVTPGLFEVKSAQHSWAGPGSGNAELEALPQGLAGTTPLVLELSHHWPDLTPMAGAPYRAVFADGSRRTGTLDAHGQARLEGIPSGLAEVVYGEEARPAALQPVTLQPVDDESLAADLRRLGLDPDTVDLQALVERHAGRTS